MKLLNKSFSDTNTHSFTDVPLIFYRISYVKNRGCKSNITFPLVQYLLTFIISQSIEFEHMFLIVARDNYIIKACQRRVCLDFC